jgi:hypothetical protein
VATGVELQDARAEIGSVKLGAAGTLGPVIDLELSAEGPDLAAVLGPLTGLASLPADSFALSAHARGSSERFSSDRFDARLGDSNLEGASGAARRSRSSTRPRSK